MTNTRVSFGGFLLILLALAALAICAMFAAPKDVVEDLAAQAALSQPVIMTDHAKIRPVSEEIYNCVKDASKPIMTFKDKFEKDKFYLVCQISSGKWGLLPVISTGAGLVAKTAFVPKDGSWSEVARYLSNFATRYNGVIGVK